MHQEVLHFNSIKEIVDKTGLKILEHPAFVIFDIRLLKELPVITNQPLTLNFFTIGLKRNVDNCMSYGRTRYDFNQGVLGFTAPNQVLQINPDAGEDLTGWMILLQREFLKDHTLQKKIDQYGFFSYEVNEALHLSSREEDIVEDLFIKVHEEYHQNPDRFSRDVLLSYLDLLLKYSDRFYNRQFITRHQSDENILSRFEQLVKQFYREELYQEIGQPSVGYFSEKLNISSNYLSDYLRCNSGKSTLEHIQLELINKAKLLLLGTKLSISEIAYDLGFEYPQYFSRLFSQKTGLSPRDYRVMQS